MARAVTHPPDAGDAPGLRHDARGRAASAVLPLTKWYDWRRDRAADGTVPST